MSEYFPKPKSLGKNVKVELNLSDYATKINFKNVIDLYKLEFTKKTDLVDKLKNVPTNLSSLKCKVDKLDVDKLGPVSVDLSKVSDLAKNDAVETDIYNAKIKNI